MYQKFSLLNPVEFKDRRSLIWVPGRWSRAEGVGVTERKRVVIVCPEGPEGEEPRRQ